MITVECIVINIDKENDKELIEKISKAFFKMAESLKEELKDCAYLQAKSQKIAQQYNLL